MKNARSERLETCSLCNAERQEQHGHPEVGRAGIFLRGFAMNKNAQQI